VNDLPFVVANRTEIEKVRPFFLSVSEEEKAAHHPGVVGMFFCPSVVFADDGSSRFFFFHARLNAIFPSLNLEVVGIRVPFS
jgi:hypothetical protein